MTHKPEKFEFSFQSRDHNYTVQFWGGPLDGGEIVTDERPNCDYFIHRLSDREYLYRYRRIDQHLFRADYDGLLAVEAALKHDRTSWTVLLYFVAAAIVLIGLVVWSLR